MNKYFLILCFLTLYGCAMTAKHPVKGESVFDSSKPSQKKSKALNDDLAECHAFADEIRIKSGLRTYRNHGDTVRDCLIKKGWVISF